ncbi:hypothetical protein AAMO2058_001211100 [Amorphochlora amoebiformis]
MIFFCFCITSSVTLSSKSVQRFGSYISRRKHHIHCLKHEVVVNIATGEGGLLDEIHHDEKFLLTRATSTVNCQMSSLLLRSAEEDKRKKICPSLSKIEIAASSTSEL